MLNESITIYSYAYSTDVQNSRRFTVDRNFMSVVTIPEKQGRHIKSVFFPSWKKWSSRVTIIRG